MLWSDHGWHPGEKEHWRKFTGWRICGRVPLMVRVPKGVAALPEGTRAGSECERPVSLVDLFRTLTDLCGGCYGGAQAKTHPPTASPHAASAGRDRNGKLTRQVKVRRLSG